MITFYKVNNRAELNEIITTDGNIIFVLDTNEIYVDIGNTRGSYGLAKSASDISITSTYGNNVQLAVTNMDYKYEEMASEFGTAYDTAYTYCEGANASYNYLKDGALNATYDTSTNTLTIKKGGY